MLRRWTKVNIQVIIIYRRKILIIIYSSIRILSLFSFYRMKKQKISKVSTAKTPKATGATKTGEASKVNSSNTNTEGEIFLEDEAAKKNAKFEPQKQEKTKKRGKVSEFKKPRSRAKPAQKIDKIIELRLPEPKRIFPREEEPELELRKLVVLGKPKVDQIYEQYYGKGFQVYQDQTEVFAASFKQQYFGRSQNKFYVCQVLQQITKPTNYYNWNRWGRQGMQGQHQRFGPHSKQQAIQFHNSRISERSLRGDYIITWISYENRKGMQEEGMEEQKQTLEQQPFQEEDQSTLPKKLKQLLKIIFDTDLIQNQLKNQCLDLEVMPLNKISRERIYRGYYVLKLALEELRTKCRITYINDYSSDYCNLIPYDLYNRKRRIEDYILNSIDRIKRQVQFLQSLEAVHTTMKIIEQARQVPNMGETDSRYLKLNNIIEQVEPSCEEYEVISRYANNTQTQTNFKIQIQNIFRLKSTQFQKFIKNVPNRMLLWHGANIINFASMISQGLKMPHQQAPVACFNFGKGYYFSDVITKEAEKCYASSDQNVGLLLLCDVALGDMNNKYFSDTQANLLPPGKESIKGIGKYAPQSFELLEEVIVPSGTVGATNVTETQLQYNEYVVYDINQVRSKYLVEIRFREV